MRRPRVLIADTYQILTDALKRHIAADYDVVGTVNDGRRLLAAAIELNPEIIILDVALPRLNGLHAGTQLRRSMPQVKLIFMATTVDSAIVRSAFRSGASGFLCKQDGCDVLSAALDTVSDGYPFITPSLKPAIVELTSVSVLDFSNQSEPSRRQREVIQMLAEGLSMKEISFAMEISISAVSSHKYAAMSKLAIKSNAELMRYAIKNGFIPAEQRAGS
jgi:DNA-binding NarL/FixJ family response regulator